MNEPALGPEVTDSAAHDRFEAFGSGTLAYETSMLAETTIDLVTLLLPRDRGDDSNRYRDRTSLRNALLESLLIHARVLRDFLTKKSSPHEDDVFATWFVPTWSADLKIVTVDLVTRIHKQVAHFSLERERKQPWPIVQITVDILGEMRRFLSEARANGYLLSDVHDALDEWDAWVECERSGVEDELTVSLEDIYYGS